MARIARKSDGRRIFTEEFKREQIGRVLRGDLTLAELSRKLGIARSLLQRWKRSLIQGGGGAGDDFAGATGLSPTQFIRELQLLVGKQTVQLELLRAELAALKKDGRRPRTKR
jgi:transposase-like protein